MKKNIIVILCAVMLCGCTMQNNDVITPNESVTENTIISDSLVSRTLYATIDNEDGGTRTFVENYKNVRWNAGDEISFFAGCVGNSKYRFDGEDGDADGTFSREELVTNRKNVIAPNSDVIIYVSTANTALDDSIFSGDIYAHTGVITSNSQDSSDWKYVKYAWDYNGEDCKLTRTGENLYTLTITGGPYTFYGVPQNETIENLAFVFRSADGSVEMKSATYGDIFVSYPHLWSNYDSENLVWATKSTRCFFGVYPYSSNTSISTEGVLSVRFPDVQTYTEKSFGKGANLMVATTVNGLFNDRLLFFKNACGYLVVKLYNQEGASVKHVVLSGNNGENIAGSAKITLADNGIPKVEMMSTSTNSSFVTIDCGEGVELGTTAETATEFWFAMPETTFERGIRFSAITTEGETFSMTTSKPVEVTRSDVQPMKALNAIFNKPQNNVIYYTSSVKEEVNEECFDSPILSHTFENGVGVITFYDEITKIGNDAEDNYDPAFWRNDFMGNSSITSITLPNSIISIGRLAFSGCMALKHIVLPSNLKYIGLSAFWGCSSLESITIPNSVTTIDNYAFIDCDALTKVVIPNNVESIGVAAFSRCDNLEVFEGKFAADNGRCLIVNGQLNSVITGLTEYVIPDGVTSLGVSVFDNRGKINSGVAGDSYAQLTHIVIPNTVTEIGDYAFRHCLGLTSITIPDSVTSIGNDVFTGCSSLKEFKGEFTDGYCLIIDGVLIVCAPAATIEDHIIPNTVTSIGNYAFSGCSNIKNVTIPDSVTEIGVAAFNFTSGGTHEIVCEAIVPPTIGADCFNCQTIFVPEESVAEYRTQWSNYAPIIMSAGVDTSLIYRDNFDKELSIQGTTWPQMSSEYGNPHPDNQTGITYSSQGVTVRTNASSNGNYSDYGGSGGNNLFFGSSSSGLTHFMIKDISLDALDGNSLAISFGAYRYSFDELGFEKEKFLVYVSGDGEKWSEIDYEFAPNADLLGGRWNLATSMFTLREVPTNLYVLMISNGSAYRIDDILITETNDDAAEIDLSIGVNIDITIPEEDPEEEYVGEIIQTSVANFLMAPEDDKRYELTGKITRVEDLYYGNFDLTDETGTIWIYGLKDSTGSNWVDWSVVDLSEGDTITIQGKRSSYNGIPEMKNALYVSHTKNKEDGNENDSQGDGNTNEDEIEPDKPIVTDGVYSSDSAFVPSADDSTTRVYVLDETKIDNNLVTGFKLGTNRQTGVFTSGVINKPGDKYLNFYAVAWKGGTTTLYWRVDDGAVHRQQLTPNDGATGNPPYEITFADTDHYSVLLTGLTENSVIEFSTSENFEVVAVEPTPPATMPSNTRAIVCGVKLTDKPIAPSNNLGQ